MKPGHWLALARVLALALVAAISIYIYSIRDQVDGLAIYGYPGIFVLSFLAYATVILPAPGIAIVFAMGAIFHPLGVALSAGAGAALGEISGYLVGFSGQALVEKSKVYQRMESWMLRFGGPAIFIFSAIPNPFFDVAGAIAGTLRMPLLTFLFWCWMGETTKMVIFAYAGSSLLNIFQ